MSRTVLIENGERRRLIVAGLFQGIAGVQGNELAFIPNQRGITADRAARGLLDDQAVDLTLKRSPTALNRFAVFTFKPAVLP